ncbi:MAG: hypothetical protein EYC62_05960 [Alphaproteobacteria bacterium]|nr:MAG: hypothetical protein EYC62_05960 [Alphaproteobacteria bacterium]
MRNNTALAWALSAAAIFTSPGVAFDGTAADPRNALRNPPTKLDLNKLIVQEVPKDENSTAINISQAVNDKQIGRFDICWMGIRVNAIVPQRFIQDGKIVENDKLPAELKPSFSDWLQGHTRSYEAAIFGQKEADAQQAINNCVFLRQSIKPTDKIFLDQALLSAMEALQKASVTKDQKPEELQKALARVMALTSVGADVRQSVLKRDNAGNIVIDQNGKSVNTNLSEIIQPLLPAGAKLFPNCFLNYGYVIDLSEFLPALSKAAKEQNPMPWNDKFPAFVQRAVDSGNLPPKNLISFMLFLDWKNVPDAAAAEMAETLKNSKFPEVVLVAGEIANRAKFADNNYKPLRDRLVSIRDTGRPEKDNGAKLEFKPIEFKFNPGNNGR